MTTAPTPILGSIPVTIDRIGDLFKVTPKTVRSWIREGLPVLKAGRKGVGNGAIIDLAEVIRYLNGAAGELDAEQQRARKDKEMADKIAMENALRRGEIADVNQIGQMMSEANGIVRAKLLAMPSKLAPRLINLSAAEISEIVRVEIYEALDELADPKNCPSLRKYRDA